MASTSIRWAFNWANWHPTEKDLLKVVSCLQIEEKERIGKFVFRKDFKASVIGRLMMRKFINEYTDIPYNEIIFTRDENNKPMLENAPKSIAFNISHQGSFTVFAGEIRNVKLGVDVMKLEYTGGKRLSEFFRLMDRNFSPAEWAEIRGGTGTPESEQTAMFCRYWALKESYVKALGVGILIDLRNIEFRTSSRLRENELVTDTSLYINSVTQNWLFEESLLDSGHCVAVAVQGIDSVNSSKNALFEKISIGKLMENVVSLIPQDPEYCRQYFAKSERP